MKAGVDHCMEAVVVVHQIRSVRQTRRCSTEVKLVQHQALRIHRQKVEDLRKQTPKSLPQLVQPLQMHLAGVVRTLAGLLVRQTRSCPSANLEQLHFAQEFASAWGPQLTEAQLHQMPWT